MAGGDGFGNSVCRSKTGETLVKGCVAEKFCPACKTGEGGRRGAKGSRRGGAKFRKAVFVCRSSSLGRTLYKNARTKMTIACSQKWNNKQKPSIFHPSPDYIDYRER